MTAQTASPVNETPAQIFAAMSAVMGDMAGVGKSGFNKEQGYQFRSIEDVLAAAHTALVKHGVFFLPKVLTRIPEERETRGNRPMNVIHLEIEYTFYAADGSHVASVVWGEGSDMADKSTNKAMSQALKYNLVQALCISAGDMPDSDASAEEAGPRRPQRERFEDAAPAQGRQPRPPVTVPPLADDDPWKAKIDDIADKDEATAVYAEVAEMRKAGTIDDARAARLGSLITARVANLGLAAQNGTAASTAGPAQAQPPARIRQEDQGAPAPAVPPAADDAAGDSAEAAFVVGFYGRLAALTDLRQVLPMQREVGAAIRDRKLTDVQLIRDVQEAASKRGRELELAAKGAAA